MLRLRCQPNRVDPVWDEVLRVLPCLSRNNASDQPLCDLAAVGLPQIVRCIAMSEHIPALGPSFYSKLEGDPRAPSTSRFVLPRR